MQNKKNLKKCSACLAPSFHTALLRPEGWGKLSYRLGCLH